jgi:hypothetical protein
MMLAPIIRSTPAAPTAAQHSPRAFGSAWRTMRELSILYE